MKNRFWVSVFLGLFFVVVSSFYFIDKARAADTTHADHGKAAAEAVTEAGDDPHAGHGDAKEGDEAAAKALEAMKTQMADMEAHMGLMAKETDPEKKNKMMHDHMGKMQGAMMAMQKMMSPGAQKKMGCKMMGGGHKMGDGHKKMMEKRMDMMEKLIDMVDKRMDMMQKMMDQMSGLSASQAEKKSE